MSLRHPLNWRPPVSGWIFWQRKKKISCPFRNSNSERSDPCTSHYTNYLIPLKLPSCEADIQSASHIVTRNSEFRNDRYNGLHTFTTTVAVRKLCTDCLNDEALWVEGQALRARHGLLFGTEISV
jgi:hypothetical protein